MRGKKKTELESIDLVEPKRESIEDVEDEIKEKYLLYINFGNSSIVKRILDVLSIIKSGPIDLHFTSDSLDILFESQTMATERSYKYRVMVTLFGEKFESFYNNMSSFEQSIPLKNRARLITINSERLRRILSLCQTKRFSLIFAIEKSDSPTGDFKMIIYDQLVDLGQKHNIQAIRNELLNQEKSFNIINQMDVVVAMTVGLYDNLFSRANAEDNIIFDLSRSSIYIKGEGSLSWECDPVSILDGESDSKHINFIRAPDSETIFTVKKRNVYMHKKLLIVLRSVWLCFKQNEKGECEAISICLNLQNGAGFCYFRQD